MKVIVIDIDEQDRVKLSRRRALEELGIEDEFASQEGDDERPERGSTHADRDRGGDRGDRGGDRGRSGDSRGRGRSGGGGSSGGGRGRSGGGGRR